MKEATSMFLQAPDLQYFSICKRLKKLTRHQMSTGRGATRSCWEPLTLARLCADKVDVVLSTAFTPVAFLVRLPVGAGASWEVSAGLCANTHTHAQLRFLASTLSLHVCIRALS